MARAAAPERVGEIVDAALTVFGQAGFVRAQMSDVAAAAGVSVGTLYNYVENKDALLLLCAAYAFDPDAAIAGERPLKVGSRKAFLANLQRHISALAQLPSLDAALARRGAPANVAAEWAGIVGELFDLIAGTRRGMDALERSARDVPDLAALFYGDVRSALLDRMAAYLSRRAKSRKIALASDATVAARLAVESITWMARHRHGDPDGGTMGAATARATTVELLTRAICGHSA
ncbi:MAG: hypothetical protein QOJ00_2007 [Actinomycetota bacterium]|jgi:AcrR family transcriptional regulator